MTEIRDRDDSHLLSAILNEWKLYGVVSDATFARVIGVREFGETPAVSGEQAPIGIIVQVPQGIPEGSWLNLDGYAAFREGYGYAETQTRAIPALSKCSAEELYCAFEAFNRAALGRPGAPHEPSPRFVNGDQILRHYGATGDGAQLSTTKPVSSSLVGAPHERKPGTSPTWVCSTCRERQHGTGNICGNCSAVRTFPLPTDAGVGLPQAPKEAE